MRFPADFVWGAATSSFQIEGGRAGRDESIWDRFCTVPGAIIDGSNGDIACGHHEHAGTDVRLMSELGLGAYRFSISWPRVIPGGRGDVAPSGLDFYDRLVDQLLAARNRAVRDALPLGPAPGVGGRRRLAGAGDGVPLRRVRRRRRRRPRRSGQALGDAQRAVLFESLRIRHRFHGARSDIGRRRVCRRPSPAPRPRARRRTAALPVSPMPRSASS